MQKFRQFDDIFIAAFTAKAQKYAPIDFFPAAHRENQEFFFAALVNYFFKEKKNNHALPATIKCELFAEGFQYETINALFSLIENYDLPEQMLTSKVLQKVLFRNSFRFILADLYEIRMLNVNTFSESPETEAAVEVMADYAKENGCFKRERLFHNEHSRFAYFLSSQILPEKMRDYSGNTLVLLCGGSEKMQENYLAENNFKQYEQLNFWQGVLSDTDVVLDKNIMQPLYELAEQAIEDGLPIVLFAPFFLPNERSFWAAKALKNKMKLRIIAFIPKNESTFFEEVPFSADFYFQNFILPDKSECHRLDIVEK